MARVSPVRSSTWRGDGRTPAIENWVRNSESGGSPRTSLTPFVRSVTLSDAHAHIANTDLQLALTSSGHPLRAVEHGSGNTETALADPDIVNGKVDARDRIVDGLDSTREVRQVPVCRTELLKRHRDCYPLADEVPQVGDHLLIAHGRVCRPTASHATQQRGESGLLLDGQAEARCRRAVEVEQAGQNTRGRPI